MILEKLSDQLVSIQLEKPSSVLIVLGLLTLAVAPGALNLEIKPSTEAILPSEDPEVEMLDTLRSKYYGDTTYVVVESGSDVRNQELLEDVYRAEKRLRLEENVHSTRSPASMLYNRYGEIPGDQESLDSFDYRGSVSDSKTAMTVSIRSDTQANPDEIRKLKKSIDTALQAERSVDYTVTGNNMIDLATFSVIISDFTVITGVSFLAVLAVLFAVFRDPVRMCFPVVPVMFGLVWMMGIGGYLGADLTIISMVSAAMIMGLGIDFGIHVTKKYYSIRGQEGLFETMRELSRGLLGGSITTGVGFLALLAANLEGMHSLGIFLFAGIVSAYVGAVFLLPTLIVLIDIRN